MLRLLTLAAAAAVAVCAKAGVAKERVRSILREPNECPCPTLLATTTTAHGNVQGGTERAEESKGGC